RRPALARTPGRRARAAHPGLLKMTVTVAHALPADLDALAALFDAYRQFYGQPADPGAARDWLRQRLRFGESRALLARLDGEPAGRRGSPSSPRCPPRYGWRGCGSLTTCSCCRRCGAGAWPGDCSTRPPASPARMAPPRSSSKPPVTTPPHGPPTAPPAGTRTRPSGTRCHCADRATARLRYAAAMTATRDPIPLALCVLTVSDSRTLAEDGSGDYLAA